MNGRVRSFLLMMLALFIGTGFAMADITSGLVGYYPMDDTISTGGTVTDMSGNGHNGTAYGGVKSANSSIGLGGSIAFDGMVGSWVDFGTWVPADETTGAFTVALWGRYDGKYEGDWDGFVAKRDGWGADNMRWQFECNYDGYLKFNCEGTNDGAGVMLVPGEWIHMVASYDGANLTVYYDGVNAGTVSFTPGRKMDAHVVLGCSENTGNNPLYGEIDDVRLYNRALSDADVAELFDYTETLRAEIAGAAFQNAEIADGLALSALAYYDDSVVNSGSLTYNWSQIDGPGTVSFDPASGADVMASFTQRGIYTIGLEIDDTVYGANDVVTVRVRDASDYLPVAHWEFEENTGNVVADSANANDGVVSDPNVNWVEGWIDGANPNSAIEFNHDYVVEVTANESADPVLTDIYREMTVACWVKLPEGYDNNWNAMVSHRGENGQGWTFRMVDWGSEYGVSGQTFGLTLRGTTASDDFVAETPIADGAWHHVAATYDGQVRRLYLDGKPERVYGNGGDGEFTEAVEDHGLIAPVFSGDPIVIGGILNGGNIEAKIKAAIDDVRIYSVAITPEMATELYEMGIPNAKPTATACDDIVQVGEPFEVMLTGDYTDDGYPVGTPNFTWTLVSGPEATIVNPSSLDTLVTFAEPGVYVFELKVDDTLLSSVDTVKVKVKATNDDNLVAHWDLDQSLTDTVSGIGGTLEGHVLPTWTDGVFNDGLEFYGKPNPGQADTLSYVATEPSEMMDNILDKLTVAVWIKVNEFNMAWQPILSKGDYGQGWRLFRRDQGGSVAFGVQDANGNIDCFGDIYVADGKWHHVAGVFDGSHAYLYVDGKLDQVVNATGPLNRNTIPLHLGVTTNMNGDVLDIFRGWNGKLDDVRVYDNELLAEEVADLFYSTCEARRTEGAIMAGDVNADCFVDMYDLAVIASNWMNCNDPSVVDCD